MGRFLIHIDAQDAQDFFRRRLACVPGHPQIRTRSSPESRLLQQPPVLIILCILQFIVLLDGSAQSRGAGARLAGKREFPKGDRPAFRKSPAGYPPPQGRHPRERGRPARMLSLRLPLSFPAMLQPTALPAGTAWARPKRGRAPLPVDSGGGDGKLREDLCGRDARAPGWASSHDRVTPTGQKCQAFWRQLSLKEVHQSWCLFVFIGGSSSLTNGCFPSE